MTAPLLSPHRARLALVLVSTLLALVAAEVALRLLAPPRSTQDVDLASRLALSRDSARQWKWNGLAGIVQPGLTPALTYELRPGLSGTFRGRPFSTDDNGFRGAPVTAAKPPGVFRVVGLGDSHMFGWGVAQEEVALARLQRRLDRSSSTGSTASTASRRYQVVNCAVPGYDTTLEVERFRARCRAFAPDVVVLHVTDNDLDPPFFLRDTQPPPGLALVEAVRSLFGATPASDESIEAPLGAAATAPRKGRGAADPQAVAAARRALESLAAAAHDDGFDVLVLTIGEDGHARPAILAIARSLGWTILDAAPASLDWLARHDLPQDEAGWRAQFVLSKAMGHHPTARAHAVYADVILREFQRRGWVSAADAASGQDDEVSARGAGRSR
jgi:hypothetical protein